jgi:hypothetical protein
VRDDCGERTANFKAHQSVVAGTAPNLAAIELRPGRGGGAKSALSAVAGGGAGHMPAILSELRDSGGVWPA